jgi:hypothetical protein
VVRPHEPAHRVQAQGCLHQAPPPPLKRAAPDSRAPPPLGEPPRPAGPRAESAPPRALQPEQRRAASGAPVGELRTKEEALLPDPPAPEIADAPAPAPAEPATEGNGEPAKLEAQDTASEKGSKGGWPPSLPDEEAPAGDAPGESEAAPAGTEN